MDNYEYLTSVAQQNNQWSAEQAMKQMEFQERMSNTAHQREMADLRASGLNPVLSARSGATSPNGAAAEADGSLITGLATLLSKSLEVADNSAKANLNYSYGYSSGSGYSYGSGNSGSGILSDQGKSDGAQLLLDLASGNAKGILNSFNGFIHGFFGVPKQKYDNTATYELGKESKEYHDSPDYASSPNSMPNQNTVKNNLKAADVAKTVADAVKYKVNQFANKVSDTYKTAVKANSGKSTKTSKPSSHSTSSKTSTPNVIANAKAAIKKLFGK